MEQLDLFGTGRDRVLARGGVSIDEVERWRARGWISFDIREVHSLDEGRTCELWFVRNIARSGLSDIQIDSFLSELEKPYLYDPIRMAYSFVYGWVQCPLVPSTADRDAYIEEKLEDWIAMRVLLRELEVLRHLQQRVARAIVDAVALDVRRKESEGHS